MVYWQEIHGNMSIPSYITIHCIEVDMLPVIARSRVHKTSHQVYAPANELAHRTVSDKGACLSAKLSANCLSKLQVR